MRNPLIKGKKQGYLRRMQAQGVRFEKDADTPIWNAPALADTPLRVTGCVGEAVSAYLARHGGWVSPEDRSAPVDLYLFDETAFEDIPAARACAEGRFGAPKVLWLRTMPEGGMPAGFPTDVFDAVYCSGIPDAVLSVPHTALPLCVDFTQHNPIGHGYQSQRANIGVLLPKEGMPQSLAVPLRRWAARQDLLLWRPEDAQMPVPGVDRALLCCIAGVYGRAEAADPDCGVQALINLSGQPFSPWEVARRRATGQLVADATLEADGWWLDDPVGGGRISVADWLEVALDTHNWLLRARTQSIRAAYAQSSLPAQLSKICRETAGRTFHDPGVSVVVCSNRPDYIDKILDNFRRQLHPRRELVIVLHVQKPAALDIVAMRAKVAAGEAVQIHTVDSDALSFGYAINYGVCHTTMEYVAKFDDDDYYGPNFLSDLMPAFDYSQAQVCGRNSFHSYLVERGQIVLRKPGTEYSYCPFLPGATLVMHRDIFAKLMFEDIGSDIDGRFGVGGQKHGIKFFSGDIFQLLVIREADKTRHTWQAKDALVLRQSLPAYREIDIDLEVGRAYLVADGERVSQAEAVAMVE